MEYPASACVAGPFCVLEADRGDLVNFRRVVAGHVVREERGVPGVGSFHFFLYGVSIMGPCRTEGLCGYGGEPAPVCCPCLGDGACGCLEDGGGVCQVECLEDYGGVQDLREVVCQLWRDRKRAFMAREAYRERWARCDCNFGGRVVSSGFVVWITPNWVVASPTCMGGPCVPRVGAVPDPLIMATNLVG